ncbi:lipocalin-like domain-containing protein [Nocardia transvalensis]|uniref:lipocalin-like domain-containing protein n=1 Tax=Nocardia transvalensis TaxID=37333 RepID=UPI0018954578|nr:lipocalin-like domain-containing protein [Nocardia transvalensis]MBF6328247.1 lipocalin-like domain-containing protein [Nocardia transvalensis]
MQASDLIGCWRLLSYVELDDGDVERVGPLGPAPTGLLIYEPSGFMSVSMARTPLAGHVDGGVGQETFMGYAGTWRLDGSRVFHQVWVSAHPFQVGRELVRDASRDDSGEMLTLHGEAVIEGNLQRRRLVWTRQHRPTSNRPPNRPERHNVR